MPSRPSSISALVCSYSLFSPHQDISLRNQSDLVEEYHRQHPYLIIKEILHQFGVQCQWIQAYFTRVHKSLII